MSPRDHGATAGGGQGWEGKEGVWFALACRLTPKHRPGFVGLSRQSLPLDIVPVHSHPAGEPVAKPPVGEAVEPSRTYRPEGEDQSLRKSGSQTSDAGSALPAAWGNLTWGPPEYSPESGGGVGGVLPSDRVCA